ncbi:ABC transporter permease [Hymenobacter sp. 5317J-9]|uniref:ABC transporter permease n=1 Tax=Hymenobacter sp. 5317J-9 TaxID=2932250 RepID=UPI001FD67DDF|nr:ABC transporter permease [Hymenobacter sp. 5317J-9]UOQ98312.1 ABC transporter permease [Hymenobacter sp. 5317J-9]
MNTDLRTPPAPARAAAAEDPADQWTEIIEPQQGLFQLGLAAVWRYRDLVMLFVRRDFVASYKQTILGPIWIVAQPLLTTLMYLVIFGNIARLSTDGLPALLFYLSGVTIWNYFAQTLTATAAVFRDNAAIFGKVYFPRLAMPLSIVLSNLIRFAVQFALFLAVWGYYWLTTRTVHPNAYLLLLPVLVALMGLLSLGIGMIFSALTTKYRDLAVLLGFGIQLAMYASPVIYPVSSVPAHYRWLLQANPITPIIETLRYGFLGSGTFSWHGLALSALLTVVILLLGIVIFNRTQRSFTDTV